MVLSSFSLGAAEVEAALGRMIDRCQSGSVKACAEDLVSILGLTDKRAAVTICSLYSKAGFSFFPVNLCSCHKLYFTFSSLQDENVDLRHICFSVAALSGFVSFKSLLHTAFTVRLFPSRKSIFFFFRFVSTVNLPC